MGADIPLDQITDMTVAKFMADLAEHPGKKKGTKMFLSSIAKHARQLDTVLKTAGPRSRHNRRGQGILPSEPPFFELPRLNKDAPHKDWSIAEMRSLHAACDVMTTPSVEGVATPDWWRCLLVVGYYTGLRITALTHVRFEDIHEGWLNVPAEISKGRKGIRKWLPAIAQEHIARIKTDRAEILHVPKMATRRRLLYDDFKKLLIAADIAPHRHWKFQSIRKTHVTILANLSSSHQDDLRTAQQSAGHSSVRITLAHYASGTQEEKRVAEAVERMPSPVPPIEKVELAKPVRVAARCRVEEEFVD